MIKVGLLLVVFEPLFSQKSLFARYRFKEIRVTMTRVVDGWDVVSQAVVKEAVAQLLKL